jgi:uncharacterized membrane protein YgdD (TMEM256/DUF423 family)
MSPNGFLIKTGAWLGASGIVLGALGAHALKRVLDLPQLESFETGVRYQIFMALFPLLLAGLPVADAPKKRIGWLSIFGVGLFSFSIYLLATQPLHGINVRFLGPITPIGGLLMISAWVYLAFAGLRSRAKD